MKPDLWRRLWLIRLLLPLTLYAGVVWLVLGDFGENLFVELLGVWVTVFVIDQVYRNAEERRLAPVRRSMLADLRDIHGWVVSFIEMVLRTSATEDNFDELRTAIADDKLERLHSFVAGVHPHTPIFEGSTDDYARLSSFAERHFLPVRTKCGTFILRYGSVAPADLIERVHLLENDAFFLIASIGGVEPAIRHIGTSWASIVESERAIRAAQDELGREQGASVWVRPVNLQLILANKPWVGARLSS